MNQATFAFAGNPVSDTAKVQCRIDSEPFVDCSSPKTFSGLADGVHTAAFRAEDAAGNQDPTPATRTFTVDTSDKPAPVARISKVTVKGPKKVKKNKKATFKVRISTTGNTAATNVKIKVSGKGVSSSANVGKIDAGKSRTVSVRVKPKKPGKIKVTFKVSSGNAGGKTVVGRITVRK